MSSPNKDFVIVRYKFKKEDRVIIQTISWDAYEDLKNASTIEYCEIMN